jgi:hypothetical protein
MPAPRKILRVTLIAGAVAALPWAGAVAAPGEQITDVSGDAHGVMQPYHDGGAYGLLTDILADTCTLYSGGPDCTGNGTAIDQLSYGQADILGARISTIYDAIPVGDDGIDYRPTGIGIDIRTSAVPRIADGTVRFQVLALLPDDNCELNLQVSVPGTGAPSGDVNLHVGPTLASSCDGDVTPAHTPLDGSHIQVTTSPPGVKIAIPYSLYGPSILQYMGEETSIMEPWVHAGITSEAEEPRTSIGWLDKSPKYVGFYVGEDMPGDVPCTKNCP